MTLGSEGGAVPTPKTRMVRAAAAATLGVAFLASSTPGYVSWQQAHAVRDGEQVRTGAALVAGERRVLLTRSHRAEPIDITASPHAYRFIVGDALSVELPVTLRVGAEVARAVLEVEVPKASGDPRLAAEFGSIASTLTIRPTGGAPELPDVPGRPMVRTVTPAADGHTYVVVWTTRTRPTRDDEKPRTGADSNLWGAGAPALQGMAVGARPMTVTLAPEAAS